MAETEDYDKSATPTAHKTTHQDGGTDEISVLNLSGLLADGQTPLAHKTTHQKSGSDEISVLNLSGLLADDQHVLDSEVTDLISISDKTDLVNYKEIVDVGPLAHKTTHEDGGTDEISVAGLSGLLADDQHVLESEVLAATNYLFQDCVLYTEIVTYP